MDLLQYQTAPFKQREIINMGELLKCSAKDTAADNGVCQELAWKWLKRLSTKSDKYGTPKARMDAFWKESTITKAINRHNQSAANQLISPHKLYGLEGVQINFSYRRDVVSRWRMNGGGLFYSFSCPKYNNGKHAIAAYIPKVPGQRLINVEILTFDPNLGEFKMKAGVFPIWLRLLLKEEYEATEDNIMEVDYYNT